MSNSVNPDTGIRAYFTQNARSTGSLSGRKVTLGIICASGIVITVIGALALKGLILVGIAVSYKLAVFVTGILITAATAYSLSYQKNNIYPPPYLTEPQPFPEAGILNFESITFDRRHLFDFSYLQGANSNNPESTSQEVLEFLQNPQTVPTQQIIDGFNRLQEGSNQQKHFKQIIAKFKERQLTLTEETRATYENDIRTFITEMSAGFANCSNRVNSDLEDFYNDYVECDPHRLETLEFGNLIRNWLHSYRKNLFKETIVPHGDRHAAATNNYFRRKLGHKYGIHNPLTINDYNYANFAITQSRDGERIETLIQNAFIEQYTPQRIVERLKYDLMNPGSVNQNIRSARRSLNTEKFLDWLKDHYTVDPGSNLEDAEKILEEDVTTLKDEPLILLLKDLGIFKAR